VSTANNHAWDYGKRALFETLDNLDRVNVLHVGTARTRALAYAPVVVEHGGFNTTIGQVQGVTNVTLTQAQTPQHSHVITVVEEAAGGVVEKTPNPSTTTWLGTSNPDGLWTDSSPTLSPQFAPNTISTVGGSQPHDNMQPYTAITYIISLFGVYPTP